MLHGGARLLDLPAWIAARISSCSRWNMPRCALPSVGAVWPHTVSRGNDEAAEIFEEAPELRIAGGVGDLAMEGEILVDRGSAAVDGVLDGVETVGDFLESDPG